MDAEQAAKLRAPFPAAVIFQRPQPYKKDSPKGHCTFCGGYHGLPAAHPDYVGHADTTDRLLQVDYGWTWEPFAVDDRGLPALDASGNLWIRLTVAGLTRLGVGDGPNMKEKIGDAIRNAAMRFGVALDLWSKADRADRGADTDATEPDREPPVSAELRVARDRLLAAWRSDPKRDPSVGALNVAWVAAWNGRPALHDATPEQLDAFAEELYAPPKEG